MNPTRVMVVDDHPVVREGLILILSTQPDFLVVAEADSGAQALRLAPAALPDVVLLDLEMPDLDGVQTLQRLLQAHPGLKVIIFTAFDTDDRLLPSIRSGAAGYLLKGAPRQEIFQAIRAVQSGGSILQPMIASRLIQHLQQPSSAHPKPAAPQTPQLTPREQEVLERLARGMTNKEIAAALSITERTIKFHVGSILAKLGATNRTEAVTLAANLGLVRL